MAWHGIDRRGNREDKSLVVFSCVWLIIFFLVVCFLILTLRPKLACQNTHAPAKVNRLRDYYLVSKIMCHHSITRSQP